MQAARRLDASFMTSRLMEGQHAAIRCVAQENARRRRLSAGAAQQTAATRRRATRIADERPIPILCRCHTGIASSHQASNAQAIERRA